MLAVHPYNIWPLRVKLFTPEALKVWEKVNQERHSAFPLPTGFEFSVELEGVDGKNVVTTDTLNRSGPIEVTDGKFTSNSCKRISQCCSETFTLQHLAKYSHMSSSGKAHRCSICKETLDVTAQVNYLIHLVIFCKN